MALFLLFGILICAVFIIGSYEMQGLRHEQKMPSAVKFWLRVQLFSSLLVIVFLIALVVHFSRRLS